MYRVRALHNPATGKTWATRLDGVSTEVRQGPPGRERVTTRDHDDAATAYRWALKEELSRLRNGMVLLDPGAAPGEPRLHRFVGGPYTGALAIAPTGDGGFFCNRCAEGDEMVRVGSDGGVTAGLALPGQRLVWQAARVPGDGAVLLQVDGGVVRWRPEAGTSEEVIAYRHNPGFLGVGGGRLAGYDGTAAVVLDLCSGAELLRFAVRPELYGNHSPQMEGALSRDGRLLALCARPGEIMILDVALGGSLTTLRGDFVMVRQMEFLPDGRRVLLVETYGRWALRCLDIETGGSDPGWTELRIDSGAVALSSSGDRVAVSQRGCASIHDLNANSSPRGFVLEHVVKRCAMTWLAEDALAVHTDLGCTSVYAVS